MGIKKICHARLRTYDCPACGRYIDRNWNASVNILNWEPSAARDSRLFPLRSTQ
ncbi:MULTISPECIES: zinc ribbon domain-containing protein [unclassified Microcoleus]|uniref:zinc ribbon domain-containing protein n=1 Tax=unclassified Microcoleus TaxID=2642155 RepID=UPI002FCF1D9D